MKKNKTQQELISECIEMLEGEINKAKGKVKRPPLIVTQLHESMNLLLASTSFIKNESYFSKLINLKSKEELINKFMASYKPLSRQTLELKLAETEFKLNAYSEFMQSLTAENAYLKSYFNKSQLNELKIRDNKHANKNGKRKVHAENFEIAKRTYLKIINDYPNLSTSERRKIFFKQISIMNICSSTSIRNYFKKIDSNFNKL